MKKIIFTISTILLLAAGCNFTGEPSDPSLRNNQPVPPSNIQTQTQFNGTLQGNTPPQPATSTAVKTCPLGTFYALNQKTGEIKKFKCNLPDGWTGVFQQDFYIEKNNKQYYIFCFNGDAEGVCGEIRECDKQTKKTTVIIDLYKLLKPLGYGDNIKLLGVYNNGKFLLEQAAGEACWLESRIYIYDPTNQNIILAASLSDPCKSTQEQNVKRDADYSVAKQQLSDDAKNN